MPLNGVINQRYFVKFIKFFSYTFYSLLISLSIYCSPFSNEYYAEGYILEKGTKIAIEMADISLVCKNRGTSSRSDASGFYRISISIFPDSSDVAVLTVAKQGFNPYSKSLYALWGSSNRDTIYLTKQ